MTDRHKHPPLYFRPAPGDRERLAGHVAETGKPQARILAEMLSAFLAGHEQVVRPAGPAVSPRKRAAAPSAKDQREDGCPHPKARRDPKNPGLCRACGTYVGE